MTLAQHSNESVRWGTPAEWIEREREVFDGPIHFDPCSEAEFNAVVDAWSYLSLEERGEDGLKLQWYVPGFVDYAPDVLNVHINPPGGLIREFWRKTLAEISVKQCMWTGFAMNQLNLLADEIAHPTDFSIVYLRTRIKFVPHSSSRCKACHGSGVHITFKGSVLNEDHAETSKCKSCKGTGKVTGDRPSHTNYLCGMGVDRSRFERVYKDLGAVRHGRLAK